MADQRIVTAVLAAAAMGALPTVSFKAGRAERWPAYGSSIDRRRQPNPTRKGRKLRKFLKGHC